MLILIFVYANYVYNSLCKHFKFFNFKKPIRHILSKIFPFMEMNFKVEYVNFNVRGVT